MADNQKNVEGTGGPLSNDELQDLVASSDTGARSPAGSAGYVIAGVALCWSLFQLYIASPLPFMLSSLTGLSLVLNDAQTRAIHLAFGLFLAYMAFPALSSSPRDRIPVQDWVLSWGDLMDLEIVPVVPSSVTQAVVKPYLT